LVGSSHVGQLPWPHRRSATVGGDLGGGEEDGHGPVDLGGAVVDPERLVDPPAGEVVVHRERLAPDGVLVGSGVGPLGGGDLAEVLGGRAVDVLVAPAPHGKPLGRHEEPRGRVELVDPRDLHGSLDGAEPVARAAVERAVDEDGLGQPRLDHRSRRGDLVGHQVAAAVHAVGPRHLVSAQAVRHLDGLRRVVGVERAHAVDGVHRQAGIGKRLTAHVDGHRRRGPPRSPGVLGAADPHDGDGHRSPGIRGSARDRGAARRRGRWW
jgi:hypothetical protein